MFILLGVILELQATALDLTTVALMAGGEKGGGGGRGGEGEGGGG